MSEKYSLFSKFKKMRLLWLNLLCFLACVICGAQAGDVSITKSKVYTRDNYTEEITKLIQIEINQSLKYLFTGAGYGNQMVQRQGMAAFLRGMSDARWEEAIDTIKKFMARGESAEDLHKHFNFTGKNQLDMKGSDVGSNIQKKYLHTLEGVRDDSKKISESLNKIHEMTQTASGEHHDGDWSHFAEERLEGEVKRSRKISGDIATLNEMSSSSIALHFFDSHLA